MEANSSDLNGGELEKGRMVKGYWDASLHIFWLSLTGSHHGGDASSS